MGAGSPNKMATTGGVSSANLSSERIRGLSDCGLCTGLYIPDVGAIIYWLESGNVIKQE